MDDTSQLKRYEVQALVSHLMYRLKGEDRRRLMQEFPTIYNKLCNKTVVEITVNPSDS